MGSLVVILALQIIFITLLVLMMLCPLSCVKIRSCSRSKLNEFFFNGILAFIDGTFLVLIFMGMINLQMEKEGYVEKNDSYWCAMVALIICGLEMICVPIFFKRNFKDLGEERNLKRCGYMY